jgi:hypothetical protein
MLAFGGCANSDKALFGGNEQTWTLKSGGAIPSVQGKVEVATGEAGNRDLKVEAKHLAKPETKFDGMSTYVVWLKPADGHPVNIGVLMPNKDEEARLETKTTYTTFEILVTAEDSAQPHTPSSHEVMSTMVHVAT